ncbi:hypothetical protein MASR2M15_27120 [Anaerolineales bacterium]
MVDLPFDEKIERKIAGIRFQKVGKLYHFDYSDFDDLRASDFVIVETSRGQQMGQVMGFIEGEEDKEYRSILRIATPRDLVLKQHWDSKQAEALAVCQQKATQLGGYSDTKFVAAIYNFDGSSLTILYTVEDKVDTSSIWSELQTTFKAEVELRQIGPRDVAKLLGGFGACGETRCCSTFLTDFSPISIKMAKAQGISLNPSEITGMCGRLRCCLVYEYEQYVEARKLLPKRNKMIGTPHGKGKVIDVHPLQDAVTVYIEDVGRKLVEREELIPLEELEALARKAKQPCDKHGDEACDCGKPVGQRQADLITAAVEPSITLEAEVDVEVEEEHDAEPVKSKSTRPYNNANKRKFSNRNHKTRKPRKPRNIE